MRLMRSVVSQESDVWPSKTIELKLGCSFVPARTCFSNMVVTFRYISRHFLYASRAALLDRRGHSLLDGTFEIQNLNLNHTWKFKFLMFVYTNVQDLQKSPCLENFMLRMATNIYARSSLVAKSRTTGDGLAPWPFLGWENLCVLITKDLKRAVEN